MTTVAITTDLALVRLGVQVNAGAATLTVVREHEDGSTWPVRGLDDVVTSGGAAFAWDYEAPFAESVTYRVLEAGVVAATSAPVRLLVGDPWLRAPGLPGLDQQVEMVTKPGASGRMRPRPGVYLVPYGAATGVQVFGARQTATGWTLTVRCRTHVKAAALQSLVDSSGTLLVLAPGTRQAWQYVEVTNVTEADVVDYRLPDFDPAVTPATTEDNPSQWTVWQLECTTTTRPPGGVFGDPTASYQSLLDTYATYQALLDAKPSYLAVLRGTADPGA